jgi:predicted metal-dependent HD superfamily phosphohydrolase
MIATWYQNQITENLFNNWWHLLQSFGVEQVAAEKTFTQLVTAYSTPGRYYHTLEHIYHVLNTIQTLQNQAQDLPAVQFAAWFHDVIYNPQAQDNEEKSAIYASEILKSLTIPSYIITKVSTLILHTKHHQAASDDCDTQVLLDADLAILGTNPSRYHQYALAIRQEYAWLPDAIYLAARNKVLQQFLQRHRIYFTDLMFANFESSARHNLKAEIQFIEQIS